ncbi:multicopper oxidase family protein [Mycobacterium sp. CBMA271]|uniref:multicopper oxidase family protein n=1 Tax=unclassified Mycobacteroides TaxID=2618759 RepID=UPI0012DDEB56|nr:MULTISPECIES: multicopper oxidase family protein [unclassified Mycobacteroides]MUM15736.1 copper oxidase [Mycobacteroides sp. CBMA 326]MUM17531.1 copper oxidase [Mycobacteroides sp. CBMA 326]MUM22008.1 multicopper oxidase family protein [Mycobacteroides sp. CBMA 271]
MASGIRPMIGRRELLRLGMTVAAAGFVASCTRNSTGTATPQRVTADSPRVAAAEAARRGPSAQIRQFTLNAGPTQIDLAGTPASTWAYGGRVPGHEIRVRKGEILRVQTVNNLPAPTTVHWHGLALRNDMDGVPGLTQPEIPPTGTFDYEFAVPHPGTYWFHPHVGTQIDRGLYAPLIIEDPDDGGQYDEELVVALDDWIDGTGTDPDRVLEELRTKGMPPMDHSMGGMRVDPTAPLGMDSGDVKYPYYLANGRVAADPQTVTYRAGQRVRLRIINAGGDTAFRVSIPGVPMTVTHTDGFPVQPYKADTILVTMGERVDAVVTIPAASVPLVAVPEGKDGFAQLILRSGDTPVLGRAQDAAMLMKSQVPLDTSTLTATPEVQLQQRNPDVTHDVRLAGPVGKYTWTINGKTYDPRDGLPVREGQRARLRFINDSMMFHPMHLHGHTFAVRDAKGGHRARKDTVLVAPMKTVEVDFDADNPGQWLTHCHNIYHGETGMMTVVSYVQD